MYISLITINTVMTIDKSWITKHKSTDEFWNGLQAFLEMCKDHLNFEGKCRCPCNNCNNVEWGTIEELQRHIHSKGFCRGYKVWIHHGERYEQAPTRVQHISQTTCQMRDALNDVVRENIGIEHHTDNEENSNEPTEGLSSTNTGLNELFTLADTPLFPGCDWMSSLDFVAKISHMKAMNHWTDNSFDQLLELLRFAFSNDLALSANLDDLTYTSLSVGHATEVEDIPTDARRDDANFIDDADNDDSDSDTSDNELHNVARRDNVARNYSSDESD